MKDMRNILQAVLVAVFSSVIVFGSMALALIEGGRRVALAVTPTFIQTETVTETGTPRPSPTSPVTTTRPGKPTFTTSPTSPATFTPSPTATPVPPSPTITYVPSLPPDPTATIRVVPCGHPTGWVLYTVQKGDTLYGLSKDFGVTVAQLQLANCLGSSTIIRAGKQIYVPNVPTRTPLSSPTATATTAASATSTSAVPPTSPPTDTPTPTNVSLPSDTPLPPSPTPTTVPSTSTNTPAPTATNIPSATNTAIPPTTAPAPASQGYPKNEKHLTSRTSRSRKQVSSSLFSISAVMLPQM